MVNILSIYINFCRKSLFSTKYGNVNVPSPRKDTKEVVYRDPREC